MEGSRFPVKKIQGDRTGKCDSYRVWDMHGWPLADFTPRGAAINASRCLATPTAPTEAVLCREPGLISQR
jgi:hypothetical protein